MVEKRKIMRETPVGKAQQQVLDALGLKANSFFEANKLFASIGITVIPCRVGRTSVPTIRYQDGVGYINLDGEGEAEYVDLSEVKTKLAKFEVV